MKSTRLVLLLLLFVPVACAGGQQQASRFHTRPCRWEEPRVFHYPLDEDYEERLSVERVPKDELSLEDAEKKPSPHGAYWYRVDAADTSRPGPWTSHVYVYNERVHLTRISFEDHNDPPQGAWINEKLLYLEVWWGRVLGTALIYDVEAERIIYREMVRSGTIPYRQAQQALEEGMIDPEACKPPP